jgi:hypothetical protein
MELDPNAKPPDDNPTVLIVPAIREELDCSATRTAKLRSVP